VGVVSVKKLVLAVAGLLVAVVAGGAGVSW